MANNPNITLQSLPKYCTSNDQIITPILSEIRYSIAAVLTLVWIT